MCQCLPQLTLNHTVTVFDIIVNLLLTYCSIWGVQNGAQPGTSVADPERFDADPNPTFQADADPDPKIFR